MHRFAPFAFAILILAVAANSQTTMFTFPTGSPTNVPKLDGGHDVDGDGFADFAVACPGKVDVFSGLDGTLTLTLTDPNPGFGESVALVDVDGDGMAEVVVGAPAVPTGGISVFSAATGNLLYAVTPSSPLYSSSFGSSVANVGDVDGDGNEDFVVGDPGADPMCVDTDCDFRRGRAAVCKGNDGSLLSELDGITPPNGTSAPVAPAEFGRDVAGIADFNGDGRRDILVGAAEYNEVRIYDSTTGAVLHTFTQPPNVPRFGFSVADAGDVDNDGTTDIAIGTGPKSLPPPLLQRVFLYSGATAAHIRTINPFGPGSFGIDVVGLGDVSGDGFGDIAIAEMGVGLFPLGATHIVSGADGSLVDTLLASGLDPAFGSRLAFAGDPNADGFGDLLLARTGGADVISIQTLSTASFSTIGVGCGAVPVPTLTCTLPRLGSTMTISVANGVFSGAGFLVVSQPVAGFPIPGGPTFSDTCMIYLDRFNIDLLIPVAVNPLGAWSLTGGLPDEPSMEGAEYHMQALFLPPLGGPAVTNGMYIQFGY